MYQVYCLYFKTSQKRYIGFTGAGVLNRLKKHIQCASAGYDTYLYRAIRKYGAIDIELTILFESTVKEEALVKESEFIKLYDTMNNGYNCNNGGSGGWCVPNDKIEQWKLNLQKRSHGLSNANAIKISNDELLDIAVKFYRDNGNKLTREAWSNFSKEKGLPQSYTKYRFGGGYHNFIRALKEKLENLNIPWSEQDFVLTTKERRAIIKEGYKKKNAKN